MDKNDLIESIVVNTNLTKSDVTNAVILITKTVSEVFKKESIDIIKKVESIEVEEVQLKYA